MSALTLAILTETFPGEIRAHAIGMWAAIGGLGFGAGPVAGGFLLSFFGWASVFWVNVPIGVIGLVMAAVAVAESENRRSRGLDMPGVAVSALGLMSVTLGLIESSSHPWGSAPVAVPLVAGVVLLIGFGWWEQHAVAPMIPPALLKARSFATSCSVYVLSTVGLTGALFYVTLLYQNIDGWSVLRTGLSWLFMNIPYLVMARLAGRMHRRLSSAVIVGVGCGVGGVGGVGIIVLSLLDNSTSFVVAAAGYTLFGLGFGSSTPGIAHVAMLDVPSAVSGAASGVLNAARQIGTSVGLAVLGAIGVDTAVSDWTSKVAGFPASVRGAASGQAQNVGGARITTVAKALGSAYHHPAVDSFLHGYHLAVAVGGACMLAAGVIALIGLRRSGSVPSPEVAAEGATVRRSTGSEAFHPTSSSEPCLSAGPGGGQPHCRSGKNASGAHTRIRVRTPLPPG